MTLRFFRSPSRRRQAARHALRHLPPHLMRDIGLEPWPERPRPPFPPLW